MIRVLILSFIALPAFADQRIQMPDGGGCWMNDVGHVYGCSGGAAPAAGAQDRATARAIRETEASRQAKLQQCLRTADWPNQPGRAQCAQMYGSAAQ